MTKAEFFALCERVHTDVGNPWRVGYVDGEVFLQGRRAGPRHLLATVLIGRPEALLAVVRRFRRWHVEWRRLQMTQPDSLPPVPRLQTMQSDPLPPALISPKRAYYITPLAWTGYGVSTSVAAPGVGDVLVRAWSVGDASQWDIERWRLRSPITYPTLELAMFAAEEAYCGILCRVLTPVDASSAPEHKPLLQVPTHREIDLT